MTRLSLTHTHAWHMQHWKWCQPSINPFWHMNMLLTLLPWQQFLQDSNSVLTLTLYDKPMGHLLCELVLRSVCCLQHCLSFSHLLQSLFSFLLATWFSLLSCATQLANWGTGTSLSAREGRSSGFSKQDWCKGRSGLSLWARSSPVCLCVCFKSAHAHAQVLK